MTLFSPTYHYYPDKNWMNDPNGPVAYKGGLMLFHQYNPFGATWGNMHWKQVFSPDLVHFVRQGIALAPTENSYDQDGIFSGCCVEKEGKLYAFYTGVKPEVQCLAIADANGEPLQFVKAENNPLLLPPEERENLTGFRDPFIVKEGEGYRMLVGSGHKEKEGLVFSYFSKDLLTWEYRGIFARLPKEKAGQMWECPNLLSFGEKRRLLLVSALPQGQVLALMGKQEGDTLTLSGAHPYDLGGKCLYAPNIAFLPDGRQILYAWLREEGDRSEQGWQGALSLPREVRLLPDGTEGANPASEVVKLREKELFSARRFTLHSGDNPLRGIYTRHCEIDITFETGASTLNLELLRSRDGKQKVVLSYEGASERLLCDATKCGAKEVVGGYVVGQGITSLRVFLDGSILEVFINGRETLTTRVYPEREDGDGLRLYGLLAVRVQGLRVFAMQNIWKQETGE